jgi:hypothetical protein
MKSLQTYKHKTDKTLKARKNLNRKKTVGFFINLLMENF